MRDCDVIRRLRKEQPVSALEVLDNCRLPLQHIGAGAFRDVYHVLGTSLVLKIPRYGLNGQPEDDYETNIQHARDEYAIWKRITNSKRKYKHFKQYMPEIVYFNKGTGLIVTRMYTKVKSRRLHRKLVSKLDENMAALMGHTTADIHMTNVALDNKGNLKLIDLGCFIGGND